MPATDGIDQDYLYPQVLAKQYRKTGNWVDQDVDIEINHDAYMNAVDYDAAELAGWNGTNVPPGGKFWFKVVYKKKEAYMTKGSSVAHPRATVPSATIRSI